MKTRIMAILLITDLFKSLSQAVKDYTSEAFADLINFDVEGYSRKD